MKIKIDDVKKLRQETGAGVADCRQALEESEGDMDQARQWLRRKGWQRALEKSGRQVGAGSVFAYVHHNGRVGALLALGCETDFVAKTDEFQRLGRELALQIAASRATSVAQLLHQEYGRDPSKKVGDLVKEVIGKLGENIQVVDFAVVRV